MAQRKAQSTSYRQILQNVDNSLNEPSAQMPPDSDEPKSSESSELPIPLSDNEVTNLIENMYSDSSVPLPGIIALCGDPDSNPVGFNAWDTWFALQGVSVLTPCIIPPKSNNTRLKLGDLAFNEKINNASCVLIIPDANNFVRPHVIAPLMMALTKEIRVFSCIAELQGLKKSLTPITVGDDTTALGVRTIYELTAEDVHCLGRYSHSKTGGKKAVASGKPGLPGTGAPLQSSLGPKHSQITQEKK